MTRRFALLAAGLLAVSPLVLPAPPATAASASVTLSVLRAQQVLAGLDYLPLGFSHALTPAPAPQAGGFFWRVTLPLATRQSWRTAAPNPLFAAALMSFERLANLPTYPYLTAQSSSALLAAAAAHRRDPTTYNAVYVTESSPERAYLYVNGRLQFATLANTGVPGAPTSLGTYPVYLRYVSQTMSGTNLNGSHYSDPGIPWVSYFNGGDAIHYMPRASYGYPQSLGCVELPYAAAQRVWGYLTYGSLVTVT